MGRATRDALRWHNPGGSCRVATVTFIVTKAIVWPPAIVMTAGSVLGGYSSAHYAQKLPQSRVKGFVILVGAAMTIVFFWRGYH